MKQQTTNEDVLCNSHGEDIDELTDFITGYINFCVNNFPIETVCCFPNNKPWFTRDIKVLLNEEKRTVRGRDTEDVKRDQRELKVVIKLGKDSYRRKLEEKLQQNNDVA